MKLTSSCYFSLLFSPHENGLICIYPLNGLEHTEVFGKWFFFVFYPVNWKYFVIPKPLPKHGKSSLFFGLYIQQTLPWA
jgi:hypothetical protein